jgi:hypothetical protein
MSSNNAKATSSKWTSFTTEQLNAKLGSLGLFINKPEHVVICIRCCYALQPSGASVSKHVGDKHSIPAAARKGLKAFIASLHFEDPNKIALRQRGCAPHPYLLVKTGFACKHCDLCTTSRELVQRHLSQQHDLRNSHGQQIENSTCQNVGLQSWSQNGRRGYWVVDTKAHMALSSPANSSAQRSPRRIARLAALHESERRHHGMEMYPT